MRNILELAALAAVTVATASCTADSAESAESADSADEDLGVAESALTSDPWQNVFAVRRVGSTFTFNPIADVQMICPDGVWRTECTIARINLGAAGLSTARQGEVLARMSAEPADESRASVLVKGLVVTVRDHRTSPAQTYTELRASAVYWAPTSRAHATAMRYVASGLVDGYYPTKAVNTDMMSRTLNTTVAARLRWVGPSGEQPSSYEADSFVTYSAARPIGPAGLSTPYELDVDQRFRRVAPESRRLLMPSTYSLSSAGS